MNSRRSDQNSITGNAGVNYAAWQLSRRGWHVLHTVRNVRGADLYVTDSDGTVFFGVQSKASAARNPIGLGLNLDDLRSEWWIVTVDANSDHPICYVMKIEEVRELAKQDKNGGKWWLGTRDYARDEFKESWSRIGDHTFGRKLAPQRQQSRQPTGSKLGGNSREERNGVKRPGPGGKCSAVWEYLDIYPTATAKEMREVATSVGWNLNNTSIEYYRWRKFHGLAARAKDAMPA